MVDEYCLLWAQWGILNLRQSELLLSFFGSFEKAWKKVTPEFLRQLGMRPSKIQRVFEERKSLSLNTIFQTIDHFNIQLYCYKDDVYPHFLRQLPTAPPFLFVRGRLPSFHKSISVVGTRAITHYGKRITQRLTSDLVSEGFVIVSGLALGVDSIAHKSTVQLGGVTVAVFGSGVDEICPRTNHRLAQEILDSNGALISAYPLGTLPASFHFPQRNEIVAGLTKGTLVTEGGIKSGALITARLALESNREVFAVPSSVTQLALSGTNHLIRKGEAKLVENIDHILDDFGMRSGKKTIHAQDFDKDERHILEKLSLEPKTIDQLFAETEFNIPRLSELLIYLQLKNAVAQQGDKWVLN